MVREMGDPMARVSPTNFDTIYFVFKILLLRS